jgi:hypothetical protein
MDCFFHSNVPSVAACADCRKPICATCRDANGMCPSCRLAAKIDAASASRQPLGGQVGSPNYGYRPEPPPPQQPVTKVTQASVTVVDAPESRALVALGFPLFPLALLALFDRKQSPLLRRQAYLALGLNLGVAAMWGVLQLLGQIAIPNIAASADIMMALLVPTFLVASVYYGIRTWQGEEIRIPILSDWVEEHLPANS